MKNLLSIIVVVTWLAAAPSVGVAAEPDVQVLEASWVMNAPVAGDHALALIRKVTAQIDQADFAEGEWREYKVGLSDVKVTLTLLHRYDRAAADFPVPAAGAEEWSLKLVNTAYAATIEWTTMPDDRGAIQRVYTQDDRLRMLPRFAADPHVAMNAALQHARLDALHPSASLAGALRGGHPVWEPADGEAFVARSERARLPRLLIVASGYNAFRSSLGRDATMGPACVGWQTCGEQRGVAASK